MVTFTDSHCHVYLDAFGADREAVVGRAVDAGVTRLLLPNIDAGSIGDLEAVLAGFPETCSGMMGLHPTSVKEDYREQMGVIGMALQQQPGRYCAVGEIGLDFYWDTTFAAEQEEVFTRQIQLALEFDLPVVIHTRHSMERAMAIVEPYVPQGLRGVFHCFSGTLRQAEQVAGWGFYLGIGGVITFKKSELPAIGGRIPLESLLLETDAPYLAPDPFRGKRNEPAYLPLIAAKLAEIRQEPLEKIAQVTTENAERLFGTF